MQGTETVYIPFQVPAGWKGNLVTENDRHDERYHKGERGGRRQHYHGKKHWEKSGGDDGKWLYEKQHHNHKNYH
ncbi:hypothetical protein BDB00DRAFT_812610 [Zychaea mexicana]|uniref:uncharacterized protein n=1 Tax=Zychaea mexicana TaxID=64656 RepID=UPI0022FEADA4|nr:uncharacterized protein BDB00DRAFT_812610 [Zychaea mexicana]KAI9495600.1 hypothetical protein BDB00DRAFT_812610 [Zychaea mexicana]